MVSLSSGIIADASINCVNAVAIGSVAALQIDDKDFRDIKLHRNDKVRTIAEKCKIGKVWGENAVVTPSVLFNRIISVLNNS